MLLSNKINVSGLYINYNDIISDINDIENTNYSFQFLGNSTQDLKEEHLLAYNNNYVSESFSIAEWSLYGSSRLGTRNIDKQTDVVFLASRNYNWIGNAVTNEVIAPTSSFTYKKYRLLGAKTFELTNHLGNVITTISDRKLMLEDAQNIGYVHHYTPEILSIGEQYAFGMSMPGRSFNVENYRYGFNGKAEENDISGVENTYDFGDRLYNVRTGRWFSVDDLYFDYVPISPYAFALNNPIALKDADGNMVVDCNGNEVKIRILTTAKGEYYLDIKFTGNADQVTQNQFNENAKKVFEAMLDVPHSRKLLQRAIDSSNKVHIELVKELLYDNSKGDDYPFGLTTKPHSKLYPEDKQELSNQNVWLVQVLEGNFLHAKNEIQNNNARRGSGIKYQGIDIKLTDKRYALASRWSALSARGIIGGHEITHFLTKNRWGERKADRSHKKIEKQKEKNIKERPKTRPRFL